MNEKEMYMNYKRNNKWLGIIDYKSLSFLIFYLVLIWNVVDFFEITLEYKIYIFVCLSIPVIVLLCININSESAIDVMITIIRFMLKNKIYVSNYLYVEDVNKTSKIFLKNVKKN
ncbi:MAG: hypothetical protein K0R72_739 [Clostridia bacterium]|jgi:hypothetical protein|nr:hypothetical protein [Clostridia bacterium]